MHEKMILGSLRDFFKVFLQLFGLMESRLEKDK